MPAGRPAKPVEVKVLEGTYRPDRDSPDRPIPTLVIEVPEPPIPLSKFAAGLWVQRCSWLIGINALASTDREALAQYCIEMANYYRYERYLNKHGEYKEIQDEEGNFVKYVNHPYVAMKNEAFAKTATLSAKFGFTPSDRSRIAAPVPKKQESPLQKLRNNRN